MKQQSLIIHMLIAVLLLFSATSIADADIPKMSEKRIVFRTQFGDLVFALYPEVAPLHVQQLMKLTELGVFDHGQVMRVIPNFVYCLSRCGAGPSMIENDMVAL